MGTAKIRHRRARRERLERLNRWFTQDEIARAGMLRYVEILAGDATSGRYFVSRDSAARIRAKLKEVL